MNPKDKRVFMGAEYNFLLSVLLVAPLIGWIFTTFHFPMFDFTQVFYVVGKVPMQPYSVKYFQNPPWVAILLSPISVFPYEFARILVILINFAVTGLLVIKYGGERVALLVTLTSYPFLFLLATGSVEWIPMLGILLGNPILVLGKPQSALLILLIWWKRAKQRVVLALFTGVFLMVSLFVWGLWPIEMIHNIQIASHDIQDHMNQISVWPFGIPLAMIVLYYAWRREDELLAIIATWLMMPHLIYHSLTAGMAILAARAPYIALPISIFIYALVLIRWYVVM